MFYVTSLDGSQVEPLTNIGSDFKMEQSVDGTFIVSFSCFPSTNNPGYDLLRSESVVTIKGNDFKVKQYNDTANSKTVTAISTFYELGKTQRDGIFSGNHTLNNHLAFVLNGTGWTYTVDSDISNVTNYINKLGDDNVIALIEKICKTHLVEYEISPNKTVHFAKQIGGDYDYQYRYKHNVSDVVLIEDTTNLHTFIRGYGADDLAVSYSSPNLSTFGKLEADPIRDDRFTNAAALTNYIANSIVDVPELAIESRIPELTSRETGERIWLIYEPLNVEMQTRILKQTKGLRNGELITESVVFGNSLLRSSIDLLVDQQEQINDTNENLFETQKEYTSKFEQTDERITLEVEQLDQSIATLDIKADNINLRVTNLATETNASINLLSDEISLKIDKGGAITDINLTPGVATINADKINLNGAVMINGTITGSTSINVTTDINLGRMIRFNDFTTISSDGGSIQLEAFNYMYYVALHHFFFGTVDFSAANLIGLPPPTIIYIPVEETGG
ncbi:prophage endopeptidase tail family protein [Solibacillus sp. FSL W7-1436]|uniref:prophage endopeptidase tail family protein n=1 Tax=Solibacillus sp. FSL W7-1436 TaxID=2921705 RepID=UPI0030F5855A